MGAEDRIIIIRGTKDDDGCSTDAENKYRYRVRAVRGRYSTKMMCICTASRAHRRFEDFRHNNNIISAHPALEKGYFK